MKTFLEQIWRHAIAEVHGRSVTRRTLESMPTRFDAVLSIGKAASAMCLGAFDVLDSCAALAVTKYGHVDAGLRGVEVIEAGHPLPDENSLLAGRRVLDFVAGLPARSRLLVLVSGGGSALVEVLRGDADLELLRKTTQQLLAGGADIQQINQTRARLSLIKNGQLLQHFSGAKVCVLAMSDVVDDDIHVIASGIAALDAPKFDYDAKIIARNADARAACAAFAAARGLPVIVNAESLFGDVQRAADNIVATLQDGDDGVYIWGGEPTVTLPPAPGCGGRSQSLALAVALGIRGRAHVGVIAAGSDGTDGPTDAAGGLVDGETVADVAGARDALRRADAGAYLQARGARFVSGPTGVNVMDLAVACKGGGV